MKVHEIMSLERAEELLVEARAELALGRASGAREWITSLAGRVVSLEQVVYRKRRVRGLTEVSQ